jgi:predicted small lipoprotein YifL
MKSTVRILIAMTAFASLIALTGCGRVAPTSPDVAVDNQTEAQPPVVTTDPAVGGASAPDSCTFIQDPSQPLLPGVLRFITSILSLVLRGTESQVASGRWALQFHAGSLSASKLISIAKATDGSMRVQFGPDGTQFGTAVDLTVSYAGTALDPASKSYTGLAPVFLYFDPAQSKWVEVTSVNDPAKKVLHVKLQHFSTYGVGGKAGW